MAVGSWHLTGVGLTLAMALARRCTCDQKSGRAAGLSTTNNWIQCLLRVYTIPAHVPQILRGIVRNHSFVRGIWTATPQIHSESRWRAQKFPEHEAMIHHMLEAWASRELYLIEYCKGAQE
ncbi:hypothetical protein B0H14DRAFT_2620125 [Mycena olivaceomarginata]|nr:hypothetical protein B0H14DRAFT_2620125 [Mycena olivaceomarginata]